MKRGDMRPQVIFFDVGETLVRSRLPYGDLLSEIGHELNIDVPAQLLGGLTARIEVRVAARTERRLPITFPAEASQRFWYQTYHDLFLRDLSTTDARRLAQAFLGLLSSPAGYALFDDTVATLERLRTDGYQLGIISNWEAWLPSLLQDVGIAHFFDHVIVSGLCGLEKPDTRIFTLALDKGGYRPEQVVYVGDRPAHDVEPVCAVGMTPILLDRTDRYVYHCARERIGSLSDLSTALETLLSQSV